MFKACRKLTTTENHICERTLLGYFSSKISWLNAKKKGCSFFKVLFPRVYCCFMMCFGSGFHALHSVVSARNLGPIHYEIDTLLQWQKLCWPLLNRTQAKHASLFKDNSRAAFLARQMLLLACRVPASLFSGCPTGDDSFLICFRETWVTGSLLSCCKKAFPVVGEFRITTDKWLSQNLLMFLRNTYLRFTQHSL